MLVAAAAALRRRLEAGGKLLALGNGGSATDAMDAVADFRDPPQGWPPRRAIDLTEDAAILTAVANDVGPAAIFQRQVIAYGRGGRRPARAVHQRRLGERARSPWPRPAGGACSPWPWWATTAAGSPPRAWPTT